MSNGFFVCFIFGCGLFVVLVFGVFFEDGSSLYNKARVGASGQVMVRQYRVLRAWV